MTLPVKVNWIRVKRNNPCPVCGKPDWCEISGDGKAVICARIQSPIKAGNAGWLHKLENAITLPPGPITPPSSTARSCIENRHIVYSAMLSLLTLSADHRENLHSRGLRDADIAVLEYRTMPDGNRYAIVKRLLTMGHKLTGIPGFFFDKEWRLSGSRGILVPVRDDFRRIQGFQIRRDKDAKPKYVWLSSSTDSWKPVGGSSPGAPLHVAYPGPYYIGCQKEEPARVWITEGPLKADIAAISLQNIVLAVPGVSNWGSVIPFLQTHYLDRSLVKVLIAFDMDRDENPAVQNHLYDLMERLLKIGFRTFNAKWDYTKKGIDDLCLTK